MYFSYLNIYYHSINNNIKTFKRYILIKDVESITATDQVWISMSANTNNSQVT